MVKYYSSQQTATPTNVFAAFRVTLLTSRVCFKPITRYIEMYHVRTFFLCGVMTFSFYVTFIQKGVYLQEESSPRFLSTIELSAWPLFIS